jgi:putative RNA 2'-phosphotransferase
MTPEQIKKKSTWLSWLLRHGAREQRLEMDEAGWAPVAAVLRLGQLSPEALEIVVRENNKSRLQWEGDRIRACQGHSLEGAPVTLEALERSWARYEGDAPIWHGTGIEPLPQIAREGLLPIARTHVHLADGLESRTGKRAGVAVMLEISPRRMAQAGVGLFVSPNGVVLARQVPPGCITGLQAMTQRARAQEAALRALFDLPA